MPQISQSALQFGLLSLLCYDKKNAVDLASRLSPETFFGSVQKLLATTAINFIREYRVPPGPQLEILLEDKIKRGEEGRYLGQLIDALKKAFEENQAKFFIDELDAFELGSSIQSAAQKALDLLDQGNVEDARAALAIKNKTSADDGEIWLNDSKSVLDFTVKEQTEFFTFGIKAFDRLKVVPERKTLSFMIAPSNAGKSWWLINAGVQCMLYRHNVVYITLEMAKEKVAMRMVQNLFSLTKEEAQKLRIPTIDRNGQINFQSIERQSVFGLRKDLKEKINRLSGRLNLVIKKYQTNALTIWELESYLDSLVEKGFIPDVIIIDYPELMKVPIGDYRLSVGLLWKEIRGLCEKFNAVGLAVSQGNKESATTKLVDVTEVAEDWSKIGTADNVFTYSQTASEKAIGICRIFSAKVRDTENRMVVMNAQSYAIGQFSLDSVLMTREVSTNLSAATMPPPAIAT